MQIMLNVSTWTMEDTVADTTTLSQSGPGSNDNESKLYTSFILAVRIQPTFTV